MYMFAETMVLHQFVQEVQQIAGSLLIALVQVSVPGKDPPVFIKGFQYHYANSKLEKGLRRKILEQVLMSEG